MRASRRKARDRHRRLVPRAQPLERDVAADPAIVREQHLAHPAPAEQLAERVHVRHRRGVLGEDRARSRLWLRVELASRRPETAGSEDSSPGFMDGRDDRWWVRSRGVAVAGGLRPDRLRAGRRCAGRRCAGRRDGRVGDGARGDGSGIGTGAIAWHGTTTTFIALPMQPELMLAAPATLELGDVLIAVVAGGESVPRPPRRCSPRRSTGRWCAARRREQHTSLAEVYWHLVGW